MKWKYRFESPWLFSLPLALVLGSAAQAQTVYVNINSQAGSAGDGKSWSTAYNNLESALEDQSAQQIFIAKGTYTPSAVYSPSGQLGGASGSAGVAGLKTFYIRDGLALLGGFTGTESDPSQRAVSASSFGPLPDPTLTVLDGSASASYHVVMVGDDVAWTGANVKLSDLTIQGGNAAGADSGVANEDFSIASIAYAHDAGGALYARYGSVVGIDNVIMTNNVCDGAQGTVQGALGQAKVINEPLLSGGGAVFAADPGTVINVSRSQFNSNISKSFGGGGGAINVLSNAALNVSQSSFSLNTSGRNGGAIRSKDAGDVHVDASTFQSNMSVTYAFPGDEGGGAIGVIDGNLYVQNSIFTGNYGQIAGGAIFFHAPFDDGNTYVLSVKNSQFNNNIGGPFGGGAIIMLAADVHDGSYADIENSVFTGNMAGQGGAIYESSFNTVANNCVFKGNTAAQWGGAVLADNFGDVQFFEPIPIATRKTLTVENSVLQANSVVGTLTNLPPYVAVYGPPFDSAIDVASVIAAGAKKLLGAPDQTLLFTAHSPTPAQYQNPPLFQIGGGAGSALMSGELFVTNSVVSNNSVAPVSGGGMLTGTGGGFLAGGVNGLIFAPSISTPFQSLDYAAVHVSHSVLAGNTPNNTATSDIMGVGSTEAAGVLLKVTP